MSIEEITKFWFEEATPKQWFEKDEAFDAQIAKRFGDTVESALAGKLQKWKDSDEGTLALIILLDQFTRNLYRGSAKSFAGDNAALALSLESQAEGFLQRNNENERYFLLMPMMHSENLAVQNASLPLFRKYAPEKAYEYAVKHRDIIAEYGRFPHRNEVLGRISTEREIEFLSKPGSSF